MIKLSSKYSQEELIKRWDIRLDPARFAGNDSMMDLYYAGSRKGNNIKLIKRNGISRDPFSTVFRGKIVSADSGSQIKGYFTKGKSDYIMTATGLGFIFAIYETVKARGTSLTAINALMIFSIAIAAFLLYPWRHSKKAYIEFLNDIL